jgi:hypothetical protein
MSAESRLQVQDRCGKPTLAAFSEKVWKANHNLVMQAGKLEFASLDGRTERSTSAGGSTHKLPTPNSQFPKQSALTVWVKVAANGDVASTFTPLVRRPHLGTWELTAYLHKLLKPGGQGREGRG